MMPRVERAEQRMSVPVAGEGAPRLDSAFDLVPNDDDGVLDGWIGSLTTDRFEQVLASLARACGDGAVVAGTMSDGRAARPVSAAGATEHGQILVLEDDPVTRTVLECVFADDGHRVRVCESREQLLEPAATTPGALAVADFWGSSHQCLADDERAQIVHLARTLPTIMVTGRTWAATVTAEEVGLTALVHKPFDVDDLAAVVAETLRAEERATSG